MKVQEDFIGLLFAIIAILITLIIPVPISENYRLSIIGAILLFYLAISIFRFSRRINDLSSELNRLGEKLKIHEQLVDIKSDIKKLKEDEK